MAFQLFEMAKQVQGYLPQHAEPYMGGLGGSGSGIGLGRTLGTGEGVSLAVGVVPVESLLKLLAGTGLFFATFPVRFALHPLATLSPIAAYNTKPKTDL
ncbi:hypothetical protein ABDD95_06150 [Mucilaginibacter sp. PAMB04274]|uniref:hypothetical protein n=1 Tax=Mucilaginibacter sp. PAMB04274 TaxID=3138568 RepID=UPI0031F6E39A